MRFETMTRLVASVFTRQPAAKARKRRARVGLECLEGKQLLHGGPLGVAIVPPPAPVPAAIAPFHAAPTTAAAPTTKNIADMERTDSTGAPAWFYHGLDANGVAYMLNQNNARLTSLQVESTSPITKF